MHRRHYIYQAEWTPAQKRKKLRKWFILDTLITVLGIAFVCFCVFIIVIFLGKVSGRDNGRFIVSAMTVVLKDGLISPGLKSLVMVIGINVLHARPNLLEKVRHGLAH